MYREEFLQKAFPVAQAEILQKKELVQEPAAVEYHELPAAEQLALPAAPVFPVG